MLEQLAFTRWFSRRYGTAVGAVCFSGVLARMLLAALLGLNGALGRSATLDIRAGTSGTAHELLGYSIHKIVKADGRSNPSLLPGRYPRVIQKPGLVEVHVRRVHLQDTVKAHDLLYPALKVLLRRGPTSQLHDAVLGCADP